MSWILFALLTVSSIVFSQSPREELLETVAGEWKAKCLYAAVRLDIASHLSKGPKSTQELSHLTGVHEDRLYRLLRLLSSQGIFKEEQDRLFSNTATGAVLAKEHPESLRELILFYSQEMSGSWDGIDVCLKEEKPAFDAVYGKPVFDYFREHPKSAKLFNSAMREKTRAVIAACMNVYDFSASESICDVGGGTGHFLAALLDTYPHLKGSLFEVPKVIDAAQPLLGKFQPRCDLIAGNFFEKFSVNAKSYLLKSVLHDWNDRDALNILKHCHAAMDKGL
jgi:hypothetical protein